MTTDNIPSMTTTPPRIRRAIAKATGPAAPPKKSDTVIKLLLRAKGATSLELIAATDWQAHSVSAFISGLRKKGRVLVREARKSGELAYRIDAPAKAIVDRETPAAITTSVADA